MKRRIRRISALVGLVLAAALPAAAQNITGTITGNIEDQTGAAIPNAPVTALNVGTGVAYHTTSNEAGAYLLPLLPLGEYRLSVELPGFKAFARTGLTLSADQRLRVDVRLEVGDMAEKVTVAAEAPLVRTDQAALGGNFTPALFDRLPGGVMQMVELLPGANKESGQSLATGHFNGSPATMSDVKIDGVPATQTQNGLYNMGSILDMVEELTIQTSNYSAEYGRGVAQVNVTTRAGTNRLHGTLVYSIQNEALNANSYMNNSVGAPKSRQRSNAFGGTILGPVLLPKIYDGRNRTFFSFGYQGSRQPSSKLTFSSVPTAAMRAGDFSGQATIYNPSSTRPGPSGGFVRDPFADNLVPKSQLDPVSLKMLEVSYPPPTLPGLANNYFYQGDANKHVDQVNIRGDHNFNDKNRLSGRFGNQPNLTRNALAFPGPAGMAYNSSNPRNNDIFTRVISVNHTYVMRPDLISNSHFGFYRMYTDKSQPGSTGENWAGKLGLKNLAPDNFPRVTISALTVFGGAGYRQSLTASNFEFSESLIWVKGRHSVKTGVEFRRLRFNDWNPGTNTSGNFTFNTLPTLDPRTQKQGLAFASFLLGIPSSTGVSLIPRESSMFRWNFCAGYLQDDFRVNHKLTLNLGVRWEMTTPRTELHKWQSNFNLKTLNLDYAGQNGHPETLYNYNRRDFQPRIGFAYAPFGGSRTVIRGGYGLVFLPVNNSISGTVFNTGPWSRSYSYVSPDSGITFPFTLQQGPPAVNLTEPFVLSPLSAATWLSRDRADAYMQQWSFNIQREVARGTLLELGYVGTRGTHLSVDYQLNQVPLALLGPGDAQSRRPYPTRGNITASYSPIGNSTYHAFGARFERRAASGLTWQGAYTFSKSIDDASGSIQDNYNRQAERSVSQFDMRHKLAYALIYELPVGKSRRLLNRGGITNAVLGGWNLSLLSVVQSGNPLSMGTVTNLTGSMGGGSRPTRLRDGGLSGEQRGLKRWFDPTAFQLPEPFTFGNTSPTEPRVHEPGVMNLDVLLAKEFRFTETRRLQLRSEFSNALNHFNPEAPNTTIGAPGVATITGGSGGRSIQLALKLYY